MGRPAVYGQVFGGELIVPIPAAASQPFQGNSGKFVVMNASYAYLCSLASVTDILGWALVGTFSSNSTAGNDIIPVNMARDAVYEMPMNQTLNETQLKAIIGRNCDIHVASGLQYACPTLSTSDQLQIVGYKYYGTGSGEQSLLVRLAAVGASHTTGVA